MEAKTYSVLYGKDYRGIRYATLKYGDEHEDGHIFSRNFSNMSELKLLVEELENEGFKQINFK